MSGGRHRNGFQMAKHCYHGNNNLLSMAMVNKRQKNPTSSWDIWVNLLRIGKHWSRWPRSPSKYCQGQRRCHWTRLGQGDGSDDLSKPFPILFPIAFLISSTKFKQKLHSPSLISDIVHNEKGEFGVFTVQLNTHKSPYPASENLFSKYTRHTPRYSQPCVEQSLGH